MLILVLFSSTAVFGSHNRFDDFVDLDTVDWFDRGLYFESLPFLDCIDLNEFYAYADSDRFDKWDRESVRRYKDRLSASDYERIANENPSDNINVGDIEDIKDFKCSTRKEFNQFADSNRGDRFDRDDYFRLYGYDSERQFDQIRRHRPNEVRDNYVDPYVRKDGFGGYALKFRPKYFQDSRYQDSRYQDGGYLDSRYRYGDSSYPDGQYEDSRYNYQDGRYPDSRYSSNGYSQPRRTYIQQIGSAHPLSNHYTFLEDLLSRY